MRTVNIKQVDAFTNKAFSGNPAGVVINADALNENDMLSIAREMNLSETAFVLKPSEDGADYKVRFFSPVKEVDLCGHATIAAVHVLAEEGKFFLREPVTTISFETKVGVLPVEIHFSDGAIKRIMMSQPKPSYAAFEGKINEVSTILGIEEPEIDGDLEIVSTGLPSLVVPIKKLNALKKVEPNFNELKRFCKKIGASILVFTFETISPLAMVHIRFFAPTLGVFEDPVTGTANGALGAYLIKNNLLHGNSPITILAEQGYSLNRPGEVTIELYFSNSRVDMVKVGGKSVTVMEGDLFLT